MDMRTPPLEIKILLELNPLKSRILVRRLGVAQAARPHPSGHACAPECFVGAPSTEIVRSVLNSTSGETDPDTGYVELLLHPHKSSSSSYPSYVITQFLPGPGILFDMMALNCSSANKT